MKAIKINCVEKLAHLTEIDYEGKGISAIYEAIDASLFQIVTLGQVGNVSVDLYIDDEGRLKERNEENGGGFSLGGDQYVGHGLILASDEEGETVGLTPNAEKRVLAMLGSILGWITPEEVNAWPEPSFRIFTL